MPNAIVHIGLPKTGSTSIQVFLAKNREALAEHGLIFQPTTILPESQVELALIVCTAAGKMANDRIMRARFHLKTLQDQRDITAAFEDELGRLIAENPEGTFIFSCEQIGAWMRQPGQRKNLDDWLRQRFENVEYLMFARPMEDYLPSVYSEAVKRSSSQSLDGFLARKTEMNIPAIIQAWVDQFPKRVRVRALPRGAKRDQIFQDLCDVLDVPVDRFRVPVAHNTSFCARQILAMRAVNWALGPAVERSQFQQRLANLARKLIAKRLRGGAPLRLTDAQRAEIQARYPEPFDVSVQRLRRQELAVDARGWPVVAAEQRRKAS